MHNNPYASEHMTAASRAGGLRFSARGAITDQLLPVCLKWLG